MLCWGGLNNCHDFVYTRRKTQYVIVRKLLHTYIPIYHIYIPIYHTYIHITDHLLNAHLSKEV